MVSSQEKMRDRDHGMFIDSVFYARNEELSQDWLNNFAGQWINVSKLGEFAAGFTPGHGQLKAIYRPIRGSYNTNWRLEFDDGFSSLIHVPIQHNVAFPDEKICAEVATMKLVREKTTIPVPEVYHWGTAAENPTGYGAFIIMEYIEHSRTMEAVMLEAMDDEESQVLSKDAVDAALLKVYRQMANITLQLSTIEGSAIGYPALPPPDLPQPSIAKIKNRSISHDMNALILASGLPPSVLPPLDQTYRTSHEYYQAQADLHLAHLIFQHNNAVLSSADGREKYVARQLFRKLARDGRLAEKEDEGGRGGAEVFQLWCDDLRPNNVLVDENDDIVGIIDWEMSYFAPPSFHRNPPWWLLIRRAELYDDGMDAWVEEYERRLPLYLRAVELEEKEFKGLRRGIDGTQGGGDDGILSQLELLAVDGKGAEGKHQITPLHVRMRQSWENGRFFIDSCTRASDAFDPFYWKYLDAKFFGKGESSQKGYQERLHLLSERDRAQMERLIAWKMETRDMEIVTEWDEKDARSLLAACLAGKLGSEIPNPRIVPYTKRPSPAASESGE